MRNQSPDVRLRFDPQLVEEAVLLRSRGDRCEMEFRQARNRIYELADDEEREESFERFHLAWFHRFQLANPLAGALQERPTLLRMTRGCSVVRVLLAKEEEADLYGSPPMNIVVKLRACSLLRAPQLLEFLRHEYTHLADMLDPAFGYEPDRDPSASTPASEQLIRERYRVLWDTWIDGRLLRRGWTSDRVRDRRRAEFRAAFPALRDPEAQFAWWFETDAHHHAEMMRFAREPEAAEADSRSRTASAGLCPLCRFQSYDLRLQQKLPPPVLAEIRQDFPAWAPPQGLCRQCADLYRSRALSRSAQQALPRS